ncbi:MAG: hypothetical protein HY908_00045 [Myxococcales bacterium]|nr:hypothetical protein [Myxococcales bacterium]
MKAGSKHPTHGRLTRAVALGAGFALGALAAACVGAGSTATCKVGADCPSGVCHDGSCVPLAGGGAGPGGGGSGAAAGGGGATTSSTTSSTSTTTGTGGGTCAPNLDGVIERAEVPIEVGLSAKFLAATNVTFDTTGTVVGGQRQWDLTVALPGDHLSLLATEPVPAWAAADFPGATYAARLSETQDLLGVFEVTSTDLLLRGVVSPVGGLSQTNLAYDPPVPVLSFPLTLNKSWSTTTTVTGIASGIAAFYTEHYDNTVDARGDLLTPFATFDALRVRVVLDRTVGVLVTRTRSFALVTECFGTAATLVSQPNELGTEFTSLSEVRRLSP